MEKYILVPVDFSSDSVNALEHAIVYSNKMGYNIRMIHVKRKNADYDPSFNLEDFDEVLRSGVIDKFENLERQYRSLLTGKMDYCVREGRVYTEISNQAKYGDARMIIMGTHGVSGFEERWAGSNAFRVVSHATCPVITIRNSFQVQPIKTIILPIDTTTQTRQKVPLTAKLAQLFDASVIAVDIREDNKASTKKKLDEYMSAVTLFLERHKIRHSRESIKAKNVAEATIEFALVNDADLIATMIDRNEYSPQLFTSPYSQQLVNHSPIPVLSVKTTS
jgi:nucleotide-binding universal stress UspA family protein